MPIEVDSDIRIFSRDEFHRIAEKVIGVSFDIQNEFGRLMDEDTYKRAIRRRCEAACVIPARREVEIKVCYRSFEKKYFIDLLFGNGLMVEAKTAERLSKAHSAQAIHYLLLTGMRHGLLLNLRPRKVEKQFVSTTLGLAQRRQYVIHDSNWISFNKPSTRLRQVFLELLNDWGAFLQMTLYREAIVHVFGGPEVALQRIPIYDGDVQVGSHEVCLLAKDTAFALTALKHGEDKMQDHLRRFLRHTRLTCLQWVNMANHDIAFRTLRQ